MTEICPVCDGKKFLKYYAKGGFLNEKKLVETKCWACRGSGFVSYDKNEDITPSRIEDMYKSLGF